MKAGELKQNLNGILTSCKSVNSLVAKYKHKEFVIWSFSVDSGENIRPVKSHFSSKESAS